MELHFITERVAFLESICVRESSREDTFEFTLPDLMPDMSAVLTAAGTALLRSKDPSPGCCEITGTAELSMTYRTAGEDTVFSGEASYPLIYRMENAKVDRDCLVIARLRILSVEARMVSSRKLLFKVTSACWAECSRERELLIPTAPEGEDYETACCTRNVNLTCLLDERPIELSNSFLLEGPPAAELLSWQTTVGECEASVSGGECTIRGTLQLAVLYRPRNEDLPLLITRSEPFSQTVERFDGDEPRECRAVAAVTSAYVTCEPGLAGDGKSIGYDIGLVLQYTVSCKKEITWLHDLYSTGNTLSCSPQILALPCAQEGECQSRTASAEIELQNVRRILDCTAGGVAAPVREPGGCSRATIWTTLTYQQEDGCICTKTVSFSDDSEPFASAGAVQASTGECVVTPVPQGCQVQLPVGLTVFSAGELKIETVSDAQISDAPAVPEEPLLWVRRYEDGDSLWAIGKAHRVAVSAIREASGLEAEEEPAPGTLLILPKF